MDQGIIRCLKAHYRKRLVKLIPRSLDSNKLLPKVSLLTALQLLVSPWNKVSQTTVVNCFMKAKISEKDQSIQRDYQESERATRKRTKPGARKHDS